MKTTSQCYTVCYTLQSNPWCSNPSFHRATPVLKRPLLAASLKLRYNLSLRWVQWAHGPWHLTAAAATFLHSFSTGQHVQTCTKSSGNAEGPKWQSDCEHGFALKSCKREVNNSSDREL
eukprot:6485693-Amphidinium_carterae.2